MLGRVGSVVALLVVTLALSLAARSSGALTVSLSGGTGASILQTSAFREGSGTNTSETLRPLVLPYAQISTVADGSAEATAQFDLSSLGFEVTFDLAREAGPSYGRLGGQVQFVVDEFVEYSASGWMSAVDPDGRDIEFSVSLYDLSPLAHRFDSYQTSGSTPNESFTLGLSGGDSYNRSLGSLSGALLPGQEYLLTFLAHLGTGNAALSQATASGNFSLLFVPEPGTNLLIATGMLCFAAWWRRLH